MARKVSIFYLFLPLQDLGLSPCRLHFGQDIYPAKNGASIFAHKISRTHLARTSRINLKKPARASSTKQRLH